MSAAVSVDMAPGEFEVGLGSLGTLRGRVDPATILEVEKRLGSFMALGHDAASKRLGFGAAVTLIEVLCRPVMGQGMPTRSEIELGVLEAGLSNVVADLARPFVYALTGRTV